MKKPFPIRSNDPTTSRMTLNYKTKNQTKQLNFLLYKFILFTEKL